MQLHILVVLLLLLVVGPVLQAQSQSQGPELLLRVDDIGVTHASNMALKEIAESGMPFSTSIMFAAPRYQEAVHILEDHPDVSVGVHLTLNSEWKGLRWGPVLGAEIVPTLVDSMGHFHHASSTFLESNFDLGEVEQELSAQVERALRSGLDIDYINPHMGTAVATEELREVVERVADQYELGIPTYFGEQSENMWGVGIEEKETVFHEHLANLHPEEPNLIIIHAAKDLPDMHLVDMNSDLGNTDDGEPLVHLHRQAELDMLLDDSFQQRIHNGEIHLLTYRELIKREGLGEMERP